MSFSVEQLTAHGISEAIVKEWVNSGVRELLPLQKEAVVSGGLLQDHSLIVFAPTSSGKTFIAEMAAARHLERNRRVIYMVPTKALAEEKYRRFNSLFAPHGYRVLVSTRERPESDQPALSGKFDVLVAVYEKMKSYLVQKPTLLSQTGLIVADEVQTLGEPERGGVVDLILTKITSSPFDIQFLGLSAVLGDASRIARWLDCRLLNETPRPVDLREGVFDAESGIFHYRSFNTGERGEEAFHGIPRIFEIENDHPGEEAVIAFARFLVSHRNEQVLIFVPTRAMTLNLADKIAAGLECPAASGAMTELERYEDTHARRALFQSLQKGVAFHNSDLSQGLRALIEDHYNSGEIRLLVSTSTLGEGVNLTGRNVIQAAEMVMRDEWTGKFEFAPLSRTRFRNQGGRAGRFGKESEFGRSILVATGKEQADRLIDEYLGGPLEPVMPPLRMDSLENAVLDLIAGGVVGSRNDAEVFFLASYTGRNVWSENEDDFRRDLNKEIDNLESTYFLKKSETGKLEVTGMGETVAVSGVQPLTASHYRVWLEEYQRGKAHPFEAILVTAFTPDALNFHIRLFRSEIRRTPFKSAVEGLLQSESLESDLIKKILYPPGGHTESDFASMKKALILNEWIGPAETYLIEKRFGIMAGSMGKLAEHFTWLILSAASLAQSLGKSGDLSDSLYILADRISAGLEEEAVGLARLRVQGLERSHRRSLMREGYDTFSSLKDADPERLRSILPPALADAVMEAVGISSSENNEKNAKNEKSKDFSNEKETSSVDESEIFLRIRNEEPGMIWISGQPVRLTPLPYQLLLCLAKRPGRLVSYITIDQEVWPDQKVERQQVSFHRSTLLKSLSPALKKKEADNLIKTYFGQGLMINLEEDDIKIE